MIGKKKFEPTQVMVGDLPEGGVSGDVVHQQHPRRLPTLQRSRDSISRNQFVTVIQLM